MEVLVGTGTLQSKKWEFVQDELLGCSIRGAFGRAKVYANPNPTRELDHLLRERLRELEVRYANPVNDEEHKTNIDKLAKDVTSKFENGSVLHKDRFRIGIAQKALNLYLKYLWCLDKVATPPHCPFDSTITAKLPLSEQQKQDLQWTKLDSLAGYQTLVDAGREEIKKTGHSSLSEWELEVY